MTLTAPTLPIRSRLLGLSLLTAALVPVSTSALAQPTGSDSSRSHGGLTVDDPPARRTESTRDRILGDFEGSLLANERRIWVGPPVPHHVPIGLEDMELIRLIPTPHSDEHALGADVDTPRGHLALYRQMFGRAGSVPGCAVDSLWDNCRQVARFYSDEGRLVFEVDFNALFPKKVHLVVHDLLLVGDTLYYNESCQTYAKDAKGRCSNVVALDVSNSKPTVRWRSAPKLSRGRILAVGEHLVTGYGFTDEKDFMHVLDRKSGKLRHSLGVKKAPELERLLAGAGGRVEVEAHLYGEPEPRRFELVGALPTPGAKRAPRARLVPR